VVDPNPFDSISKLGDLQDDIQQSMNALESAGNEVASLAQRVNDAFGAETDEGGVKRLLEATERAMIELGNAAAAFNDIMGENILDEPATRTNPPVRPALANFQQQPEVAVQLPATTRDRLKQAINELPDAVREFRATMHEFRVVLDSANKNFTNLEAFTEPLGRNGEQIAGSIVDAVDGLDRLVEEFTVLSQALNNREGTIGQLIHNPQTYKNLQILLQNANQVVIRVDALTKRLQVVTEDARTFMHKIATEPGRLVTGGLNPSVVK
jgi:hypothetical protein